MNIPYRSFIVLLFSVLHFAAAANATGDPRLDGILRRHLDAMGGYGNWERVESIRLNGTVERDGQSVDIVVVKKRPNQIRATVTVPIPGRDGETFQIIRAHDGKNAWSASRQTGENNPKRKVLSEEDASDLLADAGVLPTLIKLWRSDADLELVGIVTAEGKTLHQVQVQPKNLPDTYMFYLSTETFLVSHYETRHPTNGTTTTTLGKYVEEQNVLIPTLSTIHSEKTGTSVINTTTVKIGVGIYDEYFELNEGADAVAP